MKTVAALCVATNSIYHQMPEVECYDKRRDVHTFAGGLPVVAHPVCAPWSAFCSHQWKPVPGIKELGPLCVAWLKICGGVLEHPAHSRLFDHCALPKPGESKGDLWTIEVSQAWWGYPMLKKTWLCFCRIDRESVVTPYRAHNPRAGVGDRRRQQVMSKNQRAATHPALAQWLVTQSLKTQNP
jgi:hypothetical protein